MPLTLSDIDRCLEIAKLDSYLGRGICNGSRTWAEIFMCPGCNDCGVNDFDQYGDLS